MQTQTHPMLDVSAWTEASTDETLVIADGQTIKVNSYDGMLVIEDGPMGDARKRRYARVPQTIRHLAIMNTHGYISLGAMRWLDQCGITWAVIDRSGARLPKPLATSSQYVNPLYMRQQAMCAPGMPYASVGVKITRHLIQSKLYGQANNAEYALDDLSTAETIRAYIPRVMRARSVDTIRGHEGSAADAYWQAWKGMAVAWKRPGPRQPHWLEFPSRRSLRASWETNRGATDPVNAMLNFGYAIAENECSLSCYSASLSPAMGISHVDRAGRDSFALDLIEVMRPVVDAVIIRILEKPLNKYWFKEASNGTVTLNAPLTHRIYSEVHQRAYHITRALITVTGLLDTCKRVSNKPELTRSSSLRYGSGLGAPFARRKYAPHTRPPTQAGHPFLLGRNRIGE